MIREIDLHGKNLLFVQTELPDQIMDLYYSGFRIIRLIHGYNHGQVLRTYVRNRLRLDIKQLYPKHRFNITAEKKGTTLIKLRG